MRLKELIKQLVDMRLESAIKSVSGIPCARYFKPEDKVAEVIITISRKLV